MDGVEQYYEPLGKKRSVLKWEHCYFPVICLFLDFIDTFNATQDITG